MVYCHTMERLKSGGIVNVEDLVEFDDHDIDSVIQNLRRPQDI